MGFAIICNARKGEKFGIQHLALVDRQKSKRYWWTSDNAGIILNYRERSAAEYCVGRLKKNQARIVDYDAAVKLIRWQLDSVIETENEIMHEAAMDSVEDGWDGHKNAF